MSIQKLKCGCIHCHCVRCGHAWNSETGARPTRCAKCKDPHWDKPKGWAKGRKRSREYSAKALEKLEQLL